MSNPTLCPFCNKREIKKKTCGHPVCQIKRQRARGKYWWKKNGKVYNGRRK